MPNPVPITNVTAMLRDITRRLVSLERRPNKATWDSATGEGYLKVTGTAQQDSPALGSPVTYTGCTMAVSAGVWLIDAAAAGMSLDALDSMALSLMDVDTGSEVTGSRGVFATSTTSPTTIVEYRLCPVVIPVTATGTYQVRLTPNGASRPRFWSSSAGAPTVWITAQRIQ
jgi:hypothetical protein